MPKHSRQPSDDSVDGKISDVVSSVDPQKKSESANDNGEPPRSRRRSERDSSKRRKKHGKQKKRKKHRSEESQGRRDYSDEDGSSSDDKNENLRSRYRKHKKERKRKKHHRRERESVNGDVDVKEAMDENTKSTRSHILAQALCHLFTSRPIFAQELPVLLIRLAGGSTFDLGQMNDYVASTALEGVLECLQEFGVQKSNGEWTFQPPPGRRDERVLLRVIRSLLDEAGITMHAVAAQEKKQAETKDSILQEQDTSDNVAKSGEMQNDAVHRAKDLTSNVILKYRTQDTELGAQLAGLCQQMAQGESISLDGLPDEKLKESLEAIFLACGLEKSEMVDEDDSEDNDGDEEPSMGYALPEGDNDDIQVRLAAVMEACRNPKRRILGPTRPTEQEAAAAYDTGDEEEGPALPGEGGQSRGPALPANVLKAAAEHRELELKATASGIEVPKHSGGREEWMVVPGKFDFLSNIKAGHSIKSRGFQNKKTRGGEDETAEAPMHPAIKAEMNAIMQAHQDARGPSLMDQHRSKKQQEKKEEAGRKKQWKWNREDDLDAGRRVDKDALHMVLGGASDNLKTKFHGGLN